MDKREVLEQLKTELGALEYGRRERSVRMPWEEIAFFQDSVTCLNFGQESRRAPCARCLLMAYVPESSRNENVPCHHIPLDGEGNTIQNLDRGYNRHSVEEAVVGWLKARIAELEAELASSEAGVNR